MQHLASRLNEKIISSKGDMTRWIEDLMKRTYDVAKKTDTDTDIKLIEMKHKMECNSKEVAEMVERIAINQTKLKKDGLEQKE